MTSIPATPKFIIPPDEGVEIQVNSCAICDDGSRIVFGTSEERGTGSFAVKCYDSDGNKLWEQPVDCAEDSQGVYWTAISGDGTIVAAGGQTAHDGAGFLMVCHADTGEEILPQTATTSRVNQVSLSQDGSWLVACYGKEVVLYMHDHSIITGSYRLVGQYSFPEGASVQSAAISANSLRAIAGATIYDDEESSDSTPTGAFVSMNISESGFTNIQKTDFDVGVLHTAITADGSAWGGGLHTGQCVCFLDNAATSPAWRYTPDLAVELAYAFAICGSTSETVHVAYGVNLPVGEDPAAPQGAVFSLISQSTGSGFTPKQQWVMPTTYGVNPGVSLDSAAQYVTATDGKPDTKNEKVESPGNFYLFDNSNASIAWSYPTSLMNWPMMISANGQAIVGGSDNGNVYYWAAE